MRSTGFLTVLLVAGGALAGEHVPSEIVGTWRGTSTCTDRVAAPACKDEVVIYDFTPGDKPGTVRWKADKIVSGERLEMGVFDSVVFDAARGCWFSAYTGPRGTTEWCLTIDGGHMTGTGIMLPGKEKIRAIDVRREPR